ncbi:hypothetical protein [Thauera mechernichensis]
MEHITMHTLASAPRTTGKPARLTAAGLRAQLAQTIALLEASRADSVAQRDLAPDSYRDFYAGRVQAFDLALADLRDLVQGGAA